MRWSIPAKPSSSMWCGVVCLFDEWPLQYQCEDILKILEELENASSKSLRIAQIRRDCLQVFTKVARHTYYVFQY